MNNILFKIFPEPVSHLIMRFNIHPLAELFIKEKQKKMLKEPRRLLNLYKTKLRQLKIMIQIWIFVDSYIPPEYPTMTSKNLF